MDPCQSLTSAKRLGHSSCPNPIPRSHRTRSTSLPHRPQSNYLPPPFFWPTSPQNGDHSKIYPPFPWHFFSLWVQKASIQPLGHQPDLHARSSGSLPSTAQKARPAHLEALGGAHSATPRRRSRTPSARRRSRPRAVAVNREVPLPGWCGEAREPPDAQLLSVSNPRPVHPKDQTETGDWVADRKAGGSSILRSL